MTGHDADTMTLAVDYAKALGTADVAAVMSFFTDDVVYEDTALRLTHRGIDEVRRFFTESPRTAGNRWLVDKVYATAEGFGMAWHIGGIHDQDLPGAPATGEFFTIPGASMVRVRDRRVIRVQDFWNSLDLDRQLRITSG
ncbi:nuclear transport factor 2 family protein [Streptomyces sp. NPDC058001]|uniref:nuclear transport factor 2 family protein n=1 Tax=Streptomyces sp. NPDC058001 TaxID=3346300 RepID=UPI0036E17D90